jgi:anthranilate synthase component 2
MILIIDNYDSFSYNLYQMVGSIDPDIKMIRNDAMTADEVLALEPKAIILSPGPGRPSDAGICEEIAVKVAGKVPVLGVCLGHQAITEAYGGVVGYAKQLMHGKQSRADIDISCDLFKGLFIQIDVARYHSLAAEEESLPEVLKVISRTTDGEIMAIKHRDYDIYGLQFHPESILTPEGKTILKNFINIAERRTTK